MKIILTILGLICIVAGAVMLGDGWNALADGVAREYSVAGGMRRFMGSAMLSNGLLLISVGFASLGLSTLLEQNARILKDLRKMSRTSDANGQIDPAVTEFLAKQKAKERIEPRIGGGHV